ncbi:tail length tape measure protein [Bacillus cereus group sp. TH242-3LC]|uniref:tail length tape measure protein n=1 Tax=Bacillus cereus group sp. TH242-3LC TaxID=3018047 RepID=UPI0022E266EF|nr:tail length tape measure protein [Bacillus cereus group sp. TH242-3LC]MDA1576461.1 tail length tape measure protein [Bacillus cereus group sp. TH242-3LC]
MATQEELVVQFRAETDQIRRELAAMQREMNEFVNATARSSRYYHRSLENMGDANSEYSRRLRQMKYEQREAMRPHIEELKRTKLAYLDAAMGMATYTGSAQDLIAQVNEIGKAEKAANDEIMKLDRMKQASILQTIGMLNNMSTTSSKLQGNLQRMGNPLYNVSRGALMATNAMERLANRSSAAQLALEFLGPNANMKQLNDQIRIINQSVMGMGQAFLVVGIGAVMFYNRLHQANMEMNPKYAEAYKNMMDSITEALKPMRDAFAALMVPIYNFVNALAKMVIAFNEAHPALARFIQGTMMLVPALTLLLLPLGAGMGLLKGYRAAFAALWMIIKPAVMVLAMASPVAWALAAAITGLAVGFAYAYKNIEPFHNAINNVLKALKGFWKVLSGKKDAGVELLKAAGLSDETISKLTGAVDKVHFVLNGTGMLFKAFWQELKSRGSADKDLLRAAGLSDSAINAFTGAGAKIGHNLNAIKMLIGAFGKEVKKQGSADIDLLVAAGIPVGAIEKVVSFGRALNSALNTVKTVIKGFSLSFSGNSDGAMQLMQAMGLNDNLISMVLSFGEKLRSAFDYVKQAIINAFHGDSTQITDVFVKLIPSIIAILLGGVPGLIIGIATMFARMSDAAGIGGEVLIQKFGEVMNKFVTWYANFVTTKLPVFLEQGMQIIVSFIQGILQALPQLVETYAQIMTTLITTLTTHLPQIIQTGVALIQTLVLAIVQALPYMIEASTQIINTLVQGITQLLPLIIDTAIQIITTLVQAIIPLIPQLIDAGIQILMALVNGIIQILPQLIDAAIQIITTLMNAIVENLPLIIDAGIKILNSLIEGIIQIFPQLIDAALQIITQLTDAIIQNLPQIIESGIQILTKLIEGIIQVLPQIVDAVIKIIDKFTEVIVQNLPQIIDAGVQILTKLIDGIIQVLPQLVATAIRLMAELLKAIIEHLPELLDAGVQLIEALIDGVLSLLGEVFSSGVEIGGQLLESLGNVDLFDIGVNIVQGLINGIGSMVGEALSAAKELGSSIASTVAGVLNIHSPSRVMRDLGIYTGQGLVKGIGSMENPVYRAAKEMAVIVKDTFDSLSEGIVLGDVSMGNVSGPAIPMVSAGYKTPSSISNVSSTSGFSGATLSKSTNESRPSNSVQNATPAVIENVIVIDSTEVVRAIGDKIDVDQGKRIVNQSFVMGQKGGW